MIEQAFEALQASYLIGEADGEAWASQARSNQLQSLSLMDADEVGQRDIFGNTNAEWLLERAEHYRKRDPDFVPAAYYEGFLASVRRHRRRWAFALAGQRS
ncbi:MAG: hypothetical protein D6806_13990 [Deltaproteobacteria bacterium]|nr:MAG: hypothetical protein D6806_13990 [Deltaproteobacteria bacterium]